jgi:hypothetical protein
MHVLVSPAAGATERACTTSAASTHQHHKPRATEDLTSRACDDEPEHGRHAVHAGPVCLAASTCTTPDLTGPAEAPTPSEAAGPAAPIIDRHSRHLYTARGPTLADLSILRI